MQKFIVMAQDGYELDVHVFEAKKPKAVVQVLHGMEEHQGRYERFVEFLVANNFTVVTSDMRGHGATAVDFGYFKDKNGYIDLVGDQVEITEFIEQKYAGLPIYIFSHSMGTITTRVLLQNYSHKYEKVVLAGYPNYRSGAKLGIFLANLISAFHNPKYNSKFINKIAVGYFNKKIKNAKTPVDWISANEQNVQNYLNDPLCGNGFTVSGFNDLFHLVIIMHNRKKYNYVNKNLKILMLRGEDDACTGGKKGAEDSRRMLADAGFTNLQYIDYPNMRHEILNETDYQKVQNDILEFYNKQ